VCWYVHLQSFDAELKSTSASDANKVISGFPSFIVGKTNASLGYLAFNGVFAGWDHNTVGRYRTDFQQQQNFQSLFSG